MQLTVVLRMMCWYANDLYHEWLLLGCREEATCDLWLIMILFDIHLYGNASTPGDKKVNLIDQTHL